MTLQEYVESNGYKLSDLTPEELAIVEGELYGIEHGIDPDDGFFSPLGEFVQRKSRL